MRLIGKHLGSRGALFFVIASASMSASCNRAEHSEVTSPQPPPPVAKTAPDDSYVSISGTVAQTGPSGFVLDYGPGTITVEMDDWDWFPEGRALITNDRVIVYGVVDHDFYEKRSIEAGSVYVEDLGTRFYASTVDEEDYPIPLQIATVPTITVAGTVEDVKSKEFVLATDGGRLDINVGEMRYDPLDNEGFQHVQKGDRVVVSGALGVDLFRDLDLFADSIVTIKSASSG